MTHERAFLYETNGPYAVDPSLAQDIIACGFERMQSCVGAMTVAELAGVEVRHEGFLC